MGIADRLRGLDTRVIGHPAPPGEGGRGDGPREVAKVALLVSRAVLLVLAAVVLVGIAFTALPTNGDNVIVRNVLSTSRDATGPFEDVFTPEGEDKRLYANSALAAGVYLVGALVCGRLASRVAAPRRAA